MWQECLINGGQQAGKDPDDLDRLFDEEMGRQGEYKSVRRALNAALARMGIK
jgi:hypothetical protein